MSRRLKDWLASYQQYTAATEPPPAFHFWSGVAAIAGALRRHVWLDQVHFRWYPNCYVVLTGPAGIKKTTAANIAMSFLKQVPGVKFGPDVASWQQLTKSIAESREDFSYRDEFIPQCAVMLSSGELGNLLDPEDDKAMNLFVRLWESQEGSFKKETKHCGNDEIVNECINLLGCTTPSWIAGNFPEYILGGGFMSRCVFIYGDKPANEVAYPSRHISVDSLAALRSDLVEDLIHIATMLRGDYQLSRDAYAYGEEWYHNWHLEMQKNPPDDRTANYHARKQTHLHKLAMVLAAARRDEMVIERQDLEDAHTYLLSIEAYMLEVTSLVGKTSESLWVDRLLQFINQRGYCPMWEAYRHVHSFFTSQRRFDDILRGLTESGRIEIINLPGGERGILDAWAATQVRQARGYVPSVPAQHDAAQGAADASAAAGHDLVRSSG